MKKVGFIGAYENKTDLLLNVAKILTVVGKSVLIVDTTITEKARYIVPAINPTKSYVTTFENIDVAIGFKGLENISDYLGKQELDYDYVLIDIDSPEYIESYSMESADKNYFVTCFDTYSIKRGLDALKGFKIPTKMTKVIFAKEVLKEEEQYLNFLSEGKNAIWDDYTIYFPFELGDATAMMENQRVSKIKFKNLTNQYKEGLMYLIQDIIPEIPETTLKKTMKNLERGA